MPLRSKERSRSVRRSPCSRLGSGMYPGLRMTAVPRALAWPAIPWGATILAVGRTQETHLDEPVLDRGRRPAVRQRQRGDGCAAAIARGEALRLLDRPSGALPVPVPGRLALVHDRPQWLIGCPRHVRPPWPVSRLPQTETKTEHTPPGDHPGRTGRVGDCPLLRRPLGSTRSAAGWTSDHRRARAHG